MPSIAAPTNYDETLTKIEKLQHSDLPAAINLLKTIESEFDTMSRSQQGRFLVFKGAASIYAGQYQAAIDMLSRSEALLKDSDMLFSAYSYEATAHIALRDFNDAFNAMGKSLGLIDRIDDINLKRASYLRLASLYSAMGIIEEVATYAAKAFALASPNDVKDICVSKLYLSVHQLEIKSYSQAFEEFKSTRSFCESNGYPLIAYIALKGMGESKLRLNEPHSAVSYLLDSLKGYESFNFQLEINSAHELLSETYLMLQDFAKAELHAQYIMKLSDDSSNTMLKHGASRMLAKLNAQNKQFEQAYEYSKKEQHYNQLIFDESKMKTLAYQAAQFNANQQSREINLLNKERELYIAQQMVKEREYTNMLMFVTILVGGLFFLGILLAVGQMQKRKFMRMARMDALTGILNRGAGQELGEDLFVQATARGGDFCVILFDLDLFKRINDSYGHGTGDWVLKKVADFLKSHIRNGDVFARIGGEEFAILLPYANEEKGMEVAEQCRARIEAIETQHSGHKFVITASFGVSGLMADDLSLDPLFHRADMALYAAKSCGRNTVVRYSEVLKCDQQATDLRRYAASTSIS
ncbi:GGDEF domain-containing protein [Shewanella glacialipiscicola]|nr:GGDEF domain-containing protein [Shewanella glacialipiscicola]MCL1084991.1 GGDEF domain-containing protein [Shewanella glacialipiscicola]MCU7995006.1 GGDEF domain-containing protein [Shewanella glacialipiscicola]MCU8026414.1 GGDEF domain-containing protein [Shewanella glacialipiscicola]GIU10523.1 GGDEF domain-containing protein [Shewanella glacialipiscicola]